MFATAIISELGWKHISTTWSSVVIGRGWFVCASFDLIIAFTTSSSSLSSFNKPGSTSVPLIAIIK